MGVSAIVAGTGFEGRDRVIRKHIREGMRVRLRREPANPYDTNAVAVVIPIPRLFGLLGQRWAQIGYIKARAAKNIAAKIDSGVEISGVVTSFDTYETLQHPRVSLRLEWADV